MSEGRDDSPSLDIPGTPPPETAGTATTADALAGTEPPPADAAQATDVADAAPIAPAGEPTAWAGWLNGTAWALTVLVALQLLGIVAQGLTLTGQNVNRVHKIGFIFLRDLDAVPLGIMLIAAVVLVSLPVLARRAVTGRQERSAVRLLGVVGVLALLVALGALLAVPADLRIADVQNQDVTAVRRWFLTTFLIRNLGTALVAFAAAAAALRARASEPRSL
jgi:hypothetical protein